MIILSLNKKRGIKTAAVIVMSVFLLALCAVIAFEKKQPVADYATADEIGGYFTEASDTKAQLEFLSQFGIKADPKSKKTDTVRIPACFNEVYEDYNKLQTEIGLDLSPFKGERVSRVKYKVKGKEKYATLLIFKAHVIGAHLSTGIYGDAYEALNGKT